MKPLNLDNKPCSPISSNCVIWQGPDIPCINLCTGDTVSDVVYKIATELCTVLDTLKVDNYDLTCFNINACGPQDFQALIQFLIDQICALENLPSRTDGATSGCPDCVVSVAPCFVVGNQTTMQLLDYIQMIANKICSLIEQISFINSQITDILIRLDALENAPPPSFVIPSFTLGCQIGTLTGTQFINTILQEFINNVWCDFYATTGTTSELSNAVQSICILDTDLQLTTGTPFSTNPNWIQSANYNTVADAINNLWIALCDVYTAAGSVSVTGDTTNSIDVNVTAGVISATINDTGWVDLNGFAFYQAGMSTNKPQCRRIGNQIHFRGTVFIPIDNGFGSVIPLTSTNTYNSVYRINPHVGIGGIVYDGSNRILFNSDGVSAQSVIPISVLDAGTNLDSQYNSTQLLAIRKLDVQQFSGSANTGAVTLTAAITLNILQNKTLRIASLATIESETTDIVSFAGNSLLRGLTSSFTPRSQVIDFRNYVRQIDGNMSINQAPISGLAGVTGIVIGELYRIINYTAGDDFTNIGAVANANNQVFIATGAIPTVWTSTQLIPLSSALHYDTFYNNVPPTYLGSQWPSLADLLTPTYDAAIANNLGGFSVKLDGLSAFVNPCTLDIKPTVCP
jgi:hypothetical protein